MMLGEKVDGNGHLSGYIMPAMRRVSGVCLLLAASAAVPASAFVAPLSLKTQTARSQQHWTRGARTATEW